MQPNESLSNQQTFGGIYYIACAVFGTVDHGQKLQSLCSQGTHGFLYQSFFPERSGGQLRTTGNLELILLSHDYEFQSLCTICTQKNQLREFLIVRRYHVHTHELVDKCHFNEWISLKRLEFIYIILGVFERQSWLLIPLCPRCTLGLPALW